MILIFVTCAVFFRFVYFNVIWFSDQKKELTYVVLTNWIPCTCNLWTATYINKYKLNLWYLMNGHRAKAWVRWVVLFIEFFIVICPFTITFTSCTDISRVGFKVMSIIMATVPMILLSLSSVYITCILRRKMNFGTMGHRKCKLYVSEFFVQAILIGQLAFTSWIKYHKDNQPKLYFTGFCLYLLSVDFVPFLFVNYIMFLRIKAFYRQQKRDNDKQKDDSAAAPEQDILLAESQKLSSCEMERNTSNQQESS